MPIIWKWVIMVCLKTKVLACTCSSVRSPLRRTAVTHCFTSTNLENTLIKQTDEAEIPFFFSHSFPQKTFKNCFHRVETPWSRSWVSNTSDTMRNLFRRHSTEETHSPVAKLLQLNNGSTLTLSIHWSIRPVDKCYHHLHVSPVFTLCALEKDSSTPYKHYCVQSG